MQIDGRQRFEKSCGRQVKVAHVALSFELGGAENLLIEFARHTDCKRFDLSFVALKGDGVVGDELREMGFPAVALCCPDGLRPALIYRLARHFRRQQIDVVHTHLDRPHIYGTIAARCAGVSGVVHTRHGQSDDLSSRQRRLVRLVARWTDRFVCVSRDAALVAAARHGIPEERISTIWNGVDLSRFSATPVDRAGPVVTVARLVPEKDIGTLLHATALASRHDASLRLEIAGDGPCRGDLQRLSQQMGIGNRVAFLGTVAGVADLLARASMFVLPSQTEGISLAVLEAQARNVPVIATRVGGNTEVISDGENGLLVAPGDAQALAGAILRLRTDAELAGRLARAGRVRAERDFNVRSMVERYHSLYESLLCEVAP
jgi:glycosyltransferase involved in cell wall biosynthesis